MNRKQIAIALSAAALSLSAVPSFAQTNGLRTIHVTPETRSINVAYAETVNLDVNGSTQIVKFDGSAPVQNLQSLVPGAPSIPVYVVPSNRFAPDTSGG